jgi:hypothetical protein
MKRRLLVLVARGVVAAALVGGCGSSAVPKCPPCPAQHECDPQTGICIGFQTPLLDAAATDGERADAGVP